jgi:hypothetical protein
VRGPAAKPRLPPPRWASVDATEALTSPVSAGHWAATWRRKRRARTSREGGASKSRRIRLIPRESGDRPVAGAARSIGGLQSTFCGVRRAAGTRRAMRGDIASPILQPPSGQEVRRGSLIVPSPGGFPAGTLVEPEHTFRSEARSRAFRGFGDAPSPVSPFDAGQGMDRSPPGVSGQCR